MVTEISGIEELLEQIDPKNDKPFGEFDWKVVDNSERGASATKYLDDIVTKILLADKTVEVDGIVRADKYRRWADANKKKLTVKHLGNKTFLWLIPPTKDEDKDGDKQEASGSDKKGS